MLSWKAASSANSTEAAGDELAALMARFGQLGGGKQAYLLKVLYYLCPLLIRLCLYPLLTRLCLYPLLTQLCLCPLPTRLPLEEHHLELTSFHINGI